MKKRVLKLLVKWGWNEENASKMIEEHFDSAVRCIPDAKPSQLADFIGSVY